MSAKTTLVVVMGYGCHLTEEMQAYLNKVINFTEHNAVELVITTGGYTNRKTKPGVSEAGMMADYLTQSGISAPIRREENARTTNENLQGVKKLLGDDLNSFSEVVVFCDRSRAVKVRFLAKLILNIPVDIKTHSITTGILPGLKQWIATPLDILSLWIPFLEKLEISRRERIIDKS